jgi:hypothetical protein
MSAPSESLLLARINALALDLLSPAVTFDFCRNTAVAAAAAVESAGTAAAESAAVAAAKSAAVAAVESAGVAAAESAAVAAAADVESAAVAAAESAAVAAAESAAVPFRVYLQSKDPSTLIFFPPSFTTFYLDH